MKVICFFLFLAGFARIYGQGYTSYFTGNQTDTVTKPAGGVCLMGGATENDNAMKWFLQRARGGDVLVLRASGSNGYNDYFYSGLGISVNSVETLVVTQASASFSPYIHQKIKQAEAIWFAGGDQGKYVSYWRDSPIDSLINEAIAERHIVIGGTSAGMAILGSHYFSALNGSVTSAEVLANPYRSEVVVDSQAFIRVPFMQDVITDTHYDARDRKGRHVGFMARMHADYGIAARGIACDEYTAVCVDTLGIARVFGSYPTNDDNAWFIRTNCEINNPGPEVCSSGTPLTWNHGTQALSVCQIKGTQNGSRSFDLNDWQSSNGGIWEKWYVNNGIFGSASASAPACAALATDNGTEGHRIEVFPNPVRQGIFTLRSTDAQICGIELADVSGKVLRSQQMDPAYSVYTDVSGLPPALYLLRVHTTGGRIVYRSVLIL